MSSTRNPLTAIPLRAARWSATHPWRAILAWLAFVAIAVGLAVAVPTVDTTDADYRLGESGRADAMVDEAGLDSPTTENVLVNPRGDAELDQAAATAAVTQVRAGMRDLEGVEAVSEPQWNPDRSAQLIRRTARPGPGGRHAAPGRDGEGPGGVPGAADP